MVHILFFFFILAWKVQLVVFLPKKVFNVIFYDMLLLFLHTTVFVTSLLCRLLVYYAESDLKLSHSSMYPMPLLMIMLYDIQIH